MKLISKWWNNNMTDELFSTKAIFYKLKYTSMSHNILQKCHLHSHRKISFKVSFDKTYFACLVWRDWQWTALVALKNKNIKTFENMLLDTENLTAQYNICKIAISNVYTCNRNVILSIIFNNWVILNSPHSRFFNGVKQ